MSPTKTLGFITLVIIMTSCNKVADVPQGSSKIEITGTTIDTVKANWVVVKSSSINNGYGSITDHGFCWGTSPLPDLSGSHESLGTLLKSGSFSSKLKGLLPVTQYYTRSYAKNNYITIYGTQNEFTTLDFTLPEINTTEITNITSNSSQSGGNVTNDGNGTVAARGVCWNTTGNPTLTNCINKTQDGAGIGDYSSQVTGLTQVTIYHLVAYATNEKGTAYGIEVAFSTIANPVLPTVTTTTVTNIMQTTAASGGNITFDGGSTVTARGICWSTSTNPTTANSYSTDASGTGMFVSNLTGLTENTIYYVRAYATNSLGTAYGNELSFTTTIQFSIGLSYGGGIIFYIDGTSQHGLITADSDQSAGAPWGCWGTLIGTSTDIGTGQTNTDAIINGCSTAGIAARICNDLVLNGYDDWFLPSRDDLYQIYLNKNFLGEFSNGGYWSSSEIDDNYGYFMYINMGYWSGNSKGNQNPVRAVRSF